MNAGEMTYAEWQAWQASKARTTTASDSQPCDTGDRLRLDDGKAPFALIPTEALFALADLYRRGAEKYEPRGWEAGMDFDRCYSALQRHALKWWAGEDVDAETGANHMIAVAWNAIALYVYQTRGAGLDNREGAHE